MNGLVNNVLTALCGRFRTQLEQTSGMSIEQIQHAVMSGDKKALCWLQKAADGIKQSNPQLYAQMQQRMAQNNPFPGQR